MKGVNFKKLARESLQLYGVPKVGTAFIGYKKVRQYPNPRQPYGRDWREVILTLYIPGRALRRNGRSRDDKFRVSDAKVVAAHYLSGRKTPKKVFNSIWVLVDDRKNINRNFRWRLGKWHKPILKFNRKREACASGLHGFLSKQAAEDFSL